MDELEGMMTVKEFVDLLLKEDQNKVLTFRYPDEKKVWQIYSSKHEIEVNDVEVAICVM